MQAINLVETRFIDPSRVAVVDEHGPGRCHHIVRVGEFDGWQDYISTTTKPVTCGFADVGDRRSLANW